MKLIWGTGFYNYLSNRAEKLSRKAKPGKSKGYIFDLLLLRAFSLASCESSLCGKQRQGLLRIWF
jgi:hypothetical protein